MTTRLQVHSDQKSKPPPDIARDVTGEFGLSLSRFSIVACGTAHFAGQIGKYWIERFARLPVEVDVGSEYRYREAPVDKGGVTIFISQSGETADTLASLRYVRENGGKAVGIINVPTSSLARLTDAIAPTLAGPEIGVASTKALTCQLAALAALAISLGYPLALEGARNLKELTYIHAEAYAAGELKHGPIALVDASLPVIFIAPYDRVFEKTVEGDATLTRT
jgi:glucosamine--fructose-6-phosphate aminotransferase (isomerizing)